MTLLIQKILNEMLQLGVLINYIAIDLNAMLAKGANKRANMTKYVPTEKEENIKTELENELKKCTVRMLQAKQFSQYKVKWQH